MWFQVWYFQFRYLTYSPPQCQLWAFNKLFKQKENPVGPAAFYWILRLKPKLAKSLVTQSNVFIKSDLKIENKPRLTLSSKIENYNKNTVIDDLNTSNKSLHQIKSSKQK